MHFFSLAVVSLGFLGRAVAQTPVATGCTTVVASTVTSPSASCTVTACAACDNGLFISQQISTESSALSSATSAIFSLLSASPPVATDVLTSKLDEYSRYINFPSIFLDNIECFSADDINSLLDHLIDVANQVSQMLDQAGNDIETALGDDYYQYYVLFSWMRFLGIRIQMGDYYLWLSQGCVDLAYVDTINSRIDDVFARYPALQGYGLTASHLQSPCRNVLSYTTQASACPAKTLCPASTVPPSACASCQVPEGALSSLRSNLAVASSSIYAAAAYATVVPFHVGAIKSLEAAREVAEYAAIANIPSDPPCMPSDQLSGYLTAIASHFDVLTWAIENSATLEYPVGGPYEFVTRYVSQSYVFVYGFTFYLQRHISDPSTCYDCNDIAAYNAAALNFIARFNEYYAFNNVGTGIIVPAQLTANCVATCPTSSAPSVFSSVSSSAAPTSESSVDSSVSSADSSSSVSSVFSADTSASSADSSSVSSDSSIESSTIPSSQVSASVEPSTVASSQDSISSSVETSASSSLETSSISSGDQSASDSSSVSSEPSSSAPAYASITSTPSAVLSDASSSEPLSSTPLSPSSSQIQTESPSLSSFGFFNVSSVDRSAVPSVEPVLSSGSPDTQSFTSTTRITVPCESCSGGISVVEGPTRNTHPGLTNTYTSTAVVTVPCPKCPGGSSTFTTLTLVVATGNEALTTTTTTRSAAPALPYATTAVTSTVTTPPTVLTTAVITATCMSCPGGSTVYSSTWLTTVRSPTTPLDSTLGTRTGTPSTVGVSVVVIPSGTPTSVVAANSATRKLWSMLVFLLASAFMGL